MEQPQILEPPPPPSTTGARLLDEQLRAADAARVAEKKRIAAARKQIEQERTALAVRQAASHKVAHAERLRQEKRALLHRHINAELAHAEPASEQLLDALAARLAARHAEMCERDVNVVSQHPATPSWFKLFREIDADGSGLIDYSEFESMVREMLNLDEEEVAERSLMAAWLALDTDNSGHIQSGEFGAFMRRGEHVYRDASAPSWREKLLAERRGKADARRKQREEYMSGGGAGRVAAGPFGAFLRRGERERDATPPSMYRAAEQRRRAAEARAWVDLGTAASAAGRLATSRTRRTSTR